MHLKPTSLLEPTGEPLLVSIPLALDPILKILPPALRVRALKSTVCLRKYLLCTITHPVKEAVVAVALGVEVARAQGRVEVGLVHIGDP